MTAGPRGPVHLDYQEVDHELTPLGELVLRRYCASSGELGYEILLDGAFLMASHGCHAERAMARLAHARRAPAGAECEVLVGGLGAGHTLRAVLDLPHVTRVVVAEIGAKVVDWNRRYFATVNGGAVDDPRVELRITDVTKVLRSAVNVFDLMLLDVDNGPGWLAAPANAGLYHVQGIAMCRQALRPGGVLAVWSPRPNPQFLASLSRVFPQAEVVDTSAEGRVSGEPGSTVYLATRDN